MKSLGNMNMMGNFLQNLSFEPVSDFPAAPKVGSFIFKDKRLMICVEFAGSLPVWVPLTQEMDTYLHTQDEAATTWVIPHNLNVSTAIIQVFDENNNVVIPDEIDMSLVDTATLKFPIPVKGRAVVMMGRLDGMPKPNIVYEANFASSLEWVVDHGLGYTPIIRTYVGAFEAQPKSIVHNSPTQTTITWDAPTSGRVVCL